jgi:hypothetical protein
VPLHRRARLDLAQRRDQQHENEDQSGYSHSNVLVGGGCPIRKVRPSSNGWQSTERGNASQVGPWSYDRGADASSIVRTFTTVVAPRAQSHVAADVCGGNSTLTPARPVCG